MNVMCKKEKNRPLIKTKTFFMITYPVTVSGSCFSCSNDQGKKCANDRL